ncbi:peptidyl-tRNA hydrolase [Desulforamulus reducens MI-1]|uniref:Peptidyl-tRNA hydrolase n=1 Tax=Desulforamulus reducens (strain ATCC BAA-1160 / DSM 100696 / MI-1) TaxID=349161 RepID=PTH_DESRM|nr:aminoacyl-tRNA hydrolase [Desulforamulus reducens]A4J0Q6.1 RecName: Full=Peptidyl-tRNA hydrolase; Short=PTH [Desulforamulus reducens MI-1]ABO48659.1 peptidyl-tRNA hydrolase [Desulforamulus reducens MI-1]
MKLIVGLGNPGTEYAKTRHNIGFMVIDRLADESRVSTEKNQHKAQICQITIGSEKVILAKPQTYMNLSGQSVVALMNWYKLSPDELFVITDDMDLPPGVLRIRKNGSAGGQRGLKNIIELLGTQQFPRMRVGIGRPEHGAVDHVLGKISEAEAELINPAIQTAVEAVKVWVLEGTQAAMNKFNQKNKKKKEKEQPEAATDQLLENK